MFFPWPFQTLLVLFALFLLIPYYPSSPSPLKVSHPYSPFLFNNTYDLQSPFKPINSTYLKNEKDRLPYMHFRSATAHIYTCMHTHTRVCAYTHTICKHLLYAHYFYYIDIQ